MGVSAPPDEGAELRAVYVEGEGGDVVAEVLVVDCAVHAEDFGALVDFGPESLF